MNICYIMLLIFFPFTTVLIFTFGVFDQTFGTFFQKNNILVPDDNATTSLYMLVEEFLDI